MSKPSMKSCWHLLFTGLFGFLFLVLFKTGLLYHLEQYSLFCPKADFLRSFFEQPGASWPSPAPS